MEYRNWDDKIVWQDDKEVLVSVEHGDYEWTAWALLRDTAGRLYVATDSGCSCVSPWEGQPVYSPVDSVQEAIRIVREDADQQWGTWNRSDAEAFEKRALEVRL